jgi:hypothetical protein
MGIGNYFKSEKSAAPSPSPQPQPQHTPRHGGNSPSSMSEKRPDRSGRTSANDGELQPPTPRFSSRPQSVSERSFKSNNSSMFLDDIKHEVMVNYLYQQQCSHLWVSDGSGEIEGVLLRKTRGQYMACPPQLGSSPFAAACAALNVQVGALLSTSYGLILADSET